MMYTVLVGKRAYRVTEKRKDSLLKLASEQVPAGIYALQKGKGYIELRNDHLTKTQTKQARAAYKRSGIKAFCNGL